LQSLEGKSKSIHKILIFHSWPVLNECMATGIVSRRRCYILDLDSSVVLCH